MSNFLPVIIQDLVENRQKQNRVNAFVLFADLSGFTPLTEQLMQQGNVGAEKLSNILNEIFGFIVTKVYQGGGFIPYFAGDALTGIFPCESVRFEEFMGVVEAVYKHFEHGQRFDSFLITLKIGLSKGDIDYGIVGEEKLSYYFFGDTITNASLNQQLAEKGDIIADSSLKSDFINHKIKFEERDKLLIAKDIPVFAFEKEYEKSKPISKELLKRFYSETIIENQVAGEFKPIVSVFISFEGVPYHHLLDSFFKLVIKEVESFSGYFKEIDFTDKGGVLTLFFGMPKTFENNIERALECSWAIARHASTLNIRCRIGITEGIAFTGIIGTVNERAQYAAVGNRVNLAARLMTKAEWDSILCDENVAKTKGFEFDSKGLIHYKGVAKEVHTFQLKGHKVAEHAMYKGALIGRKQELQQLKDFSKPLFHSNFTGVASIAGEAGIGKSRLAFELRKYLEQQKVKWLVCRCDEILQRSFNPFIYFLKNFFCLNETLTGQQAHHLVMSEILYLRDEMDNLNQPHLSEELWRLKSVILALSGAQTDGNLWNQLDAKGRYDNTIQAFITLIKVISVRQPCVLELEDAQWSDEDSILLLEEIVKSTQDFPILILITSRLSDEGGRKEIINTSLLNDLGVPILDINLSMMDEDGIDGFTIEKTGFKPDKKLQEALLKSSNGNPFYVEQLIEYFKESELLETIGNQVTLKGEGFVLKGSINTILMARLDRLAAMVRETVKAAAVIGREFEVSVLTNVMNRQPVYQHFSNPEDIIGQHIKKAEESQIWKAMTDLRYIFRHALLRDAVYGMQLRSRLKELHLSIAQATELVFENNLEEHFDELAFHFEQAEDAYNTQKYLRLAADQAKRNFQNQLAINYYDKLLTYFEEDKENTIAVLLKKVGINELLGNWENALTDGSYALKLAVQVSNRMLEVRCMNVVGYIYMLKGNYTEAKLHLEKAAGLFELLSDHRGEANVYANLGTLYFRQGSYDKAFDYLTRAISLNEKYGYPSDSQLVANLGLTYMNLNKHEEGIRFVLSKLQIAKKDNDLKALATLHTNIGIIYFEKGDNDSALQNYEEGLVHSRKLGNKLLISICLGCIGNVYEKKGDFKQAMELYNEDLELTNQIGDKQGIAIVLGLIGGLHGVSGNFEQAIEYLNQNLSLCRELNYRKGIIKTLNTLGEVYYYQNNQDTALKYFNESIALAKSIDNKLWVLTGLIQKGEILLLQNKQDDVKILIQELREQIRDIENKQFQLDLNLLEMNYLVLTGEKERALFKLENLISEYSSPSEHASIYYVWSNADPENKSIREKALNLYASLLQDIPKYQYRFRYNQLKDRG